jgi:diguanylate cyclase (GGDEF)-like protein
LAWNAQGLAAVLQDPVSQLPARAGFQGQLQALIEQSRVGREPLTLVFINPEDFEVVNERFGREIGNQVIREVGQRLRSTQKAIDLVGRYGAAVFAVALRSTSLEESSPRVELLKRALAQRPYRNGSVRLGFSFGVASLVPAPEGDAESEVLELLRRADQALSSAKQTGNGRTVFSYAEPETGAGLLDRLSGIFTADLAKDYRNMLLLWDTVTIVTSSSDFEELAKQVVQRLYSTFKPERVGIFRTEGAGSPFTLVHGQIRQPLPSFDAAPPEPLELTALEDELLHRARASGRSAQERFTGAQGEQLAYALPLIARDQCLGGLVLAGGEEWLNFDSSDLIFLRALTSHVAVAIDRARLAQQEKLHQEREKMDLRAELKELQRALQQSKLVYLSSQMESLLNTAHRVAPTDATVLITGESGTGKELVARTLHELSPRRSAPLVVVDCTAIASSLIESELFGYEKGAFTGADKRGIGRLAEADGGTILLDEIGELPLAVQSKLLRFVQEKQLTPVGSSRSRRVDVRLIAATHRDLAAEVAAGQFREDLYYRLNVVRLVVPPLRDRPDDILHLAQHFLHRSAIQYQKGVLRFSPEAEKALLQHTWQGNVRELENRIRQAVILAPEDAIQPADLSLALMPEPFRAPSPGTPSQLFSRNPTRSPGESPKGEIWEQLHRVLGEQVEAALRHPHPEAFPLGQWLKEDLLLEAVELVEGVPGRAARLLGIPETTCRRRLRKAKPWAGAEPPERPTPWATVRPVLRDLLRSQGDSGQDLHGLTRDALLQEVAARLPLQQQRGAALMAVSAPTYRRWVDQRRR